MKKECYLCKTQKRIKKIKINNILYFSCNSCQKNLIPAWVWPIAINIKHINVDLSFLHILPQCICKLITSFLPQKENFYFHYLTQEDCFNLKRMLDASVDRIRVSTVDPYFYNHMNKSEFDQTIHKYMKLQKWEPSCNFRKILLAFGHNDNRWFQF